MEALSPGSLSLLIATWLERGILVLLFGLSVWSVAIMIDRRRALKRESGKEALVKLREILASGDKQKLAQWIQAHDGVHAGVLRVALEQQGRGVEKIDRAVRAFLIEERLRLEKGLAVLATMGSNTPFVGLFGTVLGIIRAFAALGDSSGGAANVMSGISLALIATATGLFVAIPAVVAFNAFSSRVKNILSECDALKEAFVSRLAGDV